MAYGKRNEAYDLSLFEEPEETKTASEIELNVKSQENKIFDLEAERSKRKKPKVNPLTAFLGTVTAALVIVAVVAIIHGQAQLTELNQQIGDAQSELTELESYYTQLSMKVETKLSPSVVEEYAKSQLGMSKTESYQKEFISLSDGDKAVVVGEEDKSFIDSLLEAISKIGADKE